MLFIDYSSVFNTIVPSKLITTLGLNTSLCNWILDFLTGLLQVVRGGNKNIRHADPQHGDHSGVRAQSPPVLPVQFTHDCTARHDSNTIIKFADDTTVVEMVKKTPATLVIVCSLCYYKASGTGVPSLGPKVFLTASTPKQLH